MMRVACVSTIIEAGFHTLCCAFTPQMLVVLVIFFCNTYIPMLLRRSRGENSIVQDLSETLKKRKSSEALLGKVHYRALLALVEAGEPTLLCCLALLG